MAASLTEAKAAASKANPSRRFAHLAWSGTVWFLRQCWVLIVLAVLGTTSYLLISHFIFQSVEVDGKSMFPTLKNSDHYWLNHLAYIHTEPHRHDIVVLKDPQDGGLVVKRIIALPGESVSFNKGRVYVNGELQDEPYLLDKTPTYAYEKSADEFICVGKDQYYVLGDNRKNSTDSRVFGPVPRQDILGKVIQ